MSRLDTDQADREALVDIRHERDRQREPQPHRHPRCVVPVVRQAFQARVIDSINAAQSEGDYIMRLTCPAPGCLGPVFVPRDSDRERVVCPSCQSHLTTRRTIDGVDLDIITDRAHTR